MESLVRKECQAAVSFEELNEAMVQAIRGRQFAMGMEKASMTMDGLDFTAEGQCDGVVG